MVKQSLRWKGLGWKGLGWKGLGWKGLGWREVLGGGKFWVEQGFSPALPLAYAAGFSH